MPVAQTCAVADTCAEPAVIHYDGIHAAILCAARKVGHQILVDIEEESFPRIKDNRAAGGDLCEEDMVAGKIVHIARNAADAVRRVGHYRLGGAEGLALLEQP